MVAEGVATEGDTVRVVLRCRPFLPGEEVNSCVRLTDHTATVFHPSRGSAKHYHFDRWYAPTTGRASAVLQGSPSPNLGASGYFLLRVL